MLFGTAKRIPRELWMLQVSCCNLGTDHQFEPVFAAGAGNSFLGGLAAGLRLNQGDVYEGI